MGGHYERALKEVGGWRERVQTAHGAQKHNQSEEGRLRDLIGTPRRKTVSVKKTQKNLGIKLLYVAV